MSITFVHHAFKIYIFYKQITTGVQKMGVLLNIKEVLFENLKKILEQFLQTFYKM